MPFISITYENLYILHFSDASLFISIAYEITYYCIMINSLHAVYSLLLSMSLAHKCMYLTSYMFYTVTIWTCL